MDWQALAIPGGLLVASLFAVLIVRRGVRIDDHPLCRKCGFDLTGKPHESSRCAECGAHLNRRNAIRIGNRRPNRRLFAAAGVVTMAFGTWFGIGAYGQIVGIDWNRHKPVTWLISETDSRDLSTRNDAFAELLRRIDGDLLDAETESMLAEAALARQADWNLPWAGEWGLLVERIDAKGRLSADRRTQYRLNSIVLVPGETTTREYLVLAIDRMPLRLSPLSAAKVGILDTLGLIYAEPTGLLDGKPIEIDIAHPWAGQSGAYLADHEFMPKDDVLRSICLVPTTPDNPTIEILLDPDQLRKDKVAEGPHVLRVNLVLRHWSVKYPHGHVERPAWGAMELERRVSLDLPFDMPPPPAAIDNSASAEDVRSAIAISDMLVGNRQTMSDRVWVRIGVDRPPVNVAFTAWVWLDSATHSAAHKTIIQCRKGESLAPQDFEFVLSRPIRGGYAGPIDVIFEPDRNQKALSPIWGSSVKVNRIHTGRSQ